MGHAGALISGEDDTAEAKLKVFRECGIAVSESPRRSARRWPRCWA
jgi:succinyl-CoA synthetase alpha subunit